MKKVLPPEGSSVSSGMWDVSLGVVRALDHIYPGYINLSGCFSSKASFCVLRTTTPRPSLFLGSVIFGHAASDFPLALTSDGTAKLKL